MPARECGPSSSELLLDLCCSVPDLNQSFHPLAPPGRDWHAPLSWQGVLVGCPPSRKGRSWESSRAAAPTGSVCPASSSHSAQPGPGSTSCSGAVPWKEEIRLLLLFKTLDWLSWLFPRASWDSWSLWFLSFLTLNWQDFHAIWSNRGFCITIMIVRRTWESWCILLLIKYLWVPVTVCAFYIKRLFHLLWAESQCTIGPHDIFPIYEKPNLLIWKWAEWFGDLCIPFVKVSSNTLFMCREEHTLTFSLSSPGFVVGFIGFGIWYRHLRGSCEER